MHMRIPSRLMGKTAVVVMTALMALVVVARGEALCLCDEDPDGCGRACHECGEPLPDGSSESEDCLHIGFAACDLAPSDVSVRWTPVAEGPLECVPEVSVLLRKTPPVRRETSPPPWIPSYCSYSFRLFPRS